MDLSDPPRLSPASLIQLSREYFLRTRDRSSRVWVFSDDEPSPFLRASHRIGNDTLSFHIVDRFAGRKPILLNYDAFTREELQLAFRPTLLLDSHVVTYLHEYVTGRPTFSADRRAAVRELLHFAILNHLDYNPFFYYLEAAAKSEAHSVQKYAEDVSVSILRLHTMRTDEFLATGVVTTDPVQLELYRNAYGAETIEQIASLHARAMIRPTDPHLDGMSSLVYATLLKMALIQKPLGGRPARKFAQLCAFMRDRLDIALAEERVLALWYFAGRYQAFIPLERGANADRLLRRLRATAWDLVLARLPAQLLGRSRADDITVGYLCTSEEALARVARCCTIESVLAIEPALRRPLPAIACDFSELQADIGEETLRDLISDDEDWQRSRIPSLTESAERMSYDALMELIRELEAEFVAFCGTARH